MGKFLKIIKDECVNGTHNDKQTQLINRCKFSTANGPTVYCLSSPDNRINRAIYSTHEEGEFDEVTSFTWRIGTDSNNKVCVYITFQTIADYLSNDQVVLCLETDTTTGKKNQRKNIRHKNKSMSVFMEEDDMESKPIPEMENITYINMSNIDINTEYCLYIGKLPRNYLRRMEHFLMRVGDHTIDTWEVEINVRPSFRKIHGDVVLLKSTLCLPEYRKLKCLFSQLIIQ
jgi:hypothetical protein